MNKKGYNLRTAVIAFSLLLVLLAANFQKASAITYGQSDANNTFSNVGALVVSIPDEGNFPVCSGTLVAARVFLTAGHCTYFLSQYIAGGDLALENIKVSFDPLDSTLSSSLWDVEALNTHPNFQPVTAFAMNDVGIVVLKNSPGIAPARIVPVGYLDQLQGKGQLQNDSAASSFTVVGYGAQLDWPPPQLNFDPTGRYYAYSQYQSLTTRWIQLNQNPVVGNGGICFGDSGGPAFWTAKNSDRLLAGVNSWVGAISCNANGYSYRLDLPEIRAFIDPFLTQ